MDLTIHPKTLSGKITAIPSKSQAHRVLICAAFSDKPTNIFCPSTNQDIEATAQCLRSLGAQIQRTATGYSVKPCSKVPAVATLDCKESGSTLRFMLPIACALGVNTTFLMSGRLPQRPLSPLWEELERHGCNLTRPESNMIRCQGKLASGKYTIDGSVSSQFITGLLFALSLIPGGNQLVITGKTESRPYIEMTRQVLSMFGVNLTSDLISGCYPFQSTGQFTIEGDWSNAAFFIAANSIGNDIVIDGLNDSSAQGDKQIISVLQQLEQFVTVDAADIPDLVPILAVVAATKSGACFTNIQRLRLKESDRVAAVKAMLHQLGVKVETSETSLIVYPSAFRSCIIDTHADHRIAMSAAIAASIADGPVTILDAHCVSKSYPAFWEEYLNLGGNYEQYIR